MERDIYKLIVEFEEAELLKGNHKNTINNKVRSIERFYMFLTEGKIKRSLLQVSEKDIEDYIKQLELEMKPKFYNKVMGHLSGFYTFLFEIESVFRNPFMNIRRLKISGVEHLGVFTEDEIKKIFSVILDTRFGKRDRAMLELLYSSGLRVGELVRLNVDDVDFSSNEILIRHGKGDIERVVPVGDKSLESLEKYFEIRYRFLKLDGEKHGLFIGSSGMRLVRATVEQRIHIYKEKAGVRTRGVAHAFRHSCATHMLSRGASFESVRQLLGHKKLSTSKIYTHVTEEDLKKVHSKSHPGG